MDLQSYTLAKKAIRNIAVSGVLTIIAIVVGTIYLPSPDDSAMVPNIALLMGIPFLFILLRQAVALLALLLPQKYNDEFRLRVFLYGTLLVIAIFLFLLHMLESST